jgi:hypothetical protein
VTSATALIVNWNQMGLSASTSPKFSTIRPDKFIKAENPHTCHFHPGVKNETKIFQVQRTNRRSAMNTVTNRTRDPLDTIPATTQATAAPIVNATGDINSSNSNDDTGPGNSVVSQPLRLSAMSITNTDAMGGSGRRRQIHTNPTGGRSSHGLPSLGELVALLILMPSLILTIGKETT